MALAVNGDFDVLHYHATRLATISNEHARTRNHGPLHHNANKHGTGAHKYNMMCV